MAKCIISVEVRSAAKRGEAQYPSCLCGVWRCVYDFDVRPHDILIIHLELLSILSCDSIRLNETF